MTALRRIVLGNWPLKLAAIGLATVLYAGVAVSDSSRTWEGPVPIEVLRAPAGGALLELPGPIREISYRAPADVAAQLTGGSFRASVDLSRVVPRLGADPVEVPVDVFSVDPRVRVTDYSPRGVDIRLDEVVDRPATVAVETGLVPSGIELGPVTVRPRQVTLRGASSRIADVREVVARLVLDGSAIDIDREIALEALDEQGTPVAGVDVDPASVRVNADVARQLALATLPVVPRLEGIPADGVVLSGVRVTPTLATIRGTEAAIRDLEAIPTALIDISGLDSDTVLELELGLPDEVEAPEVTLVRIEITLTPEIGSRAFEAATGLLAPVAGQDYEVDSASVRVVLAGPTANLDAVDAAALIAELPLSDLEPGDHLITPVVTVPDGLELGRIEPAEVTVTVMEVT